MGVALRISFRDLDRLAERVAILEHLDHESLMDSIGALVESQTKARIAAGGPAPDGTPWAAWSKDYAKTRHAGQSLLRSGDYLFGSITHLPVPGGVEVGSVRPYARIHQLGGVIIHPNRPGTTLHRYRKDTGAFLGFAKKSAKETKRIGIIEMVYKGHAFNTAITMPARPYLGLSEQDEAEVTDLVLGFLERHIA